MTDRVGKQLGCFQSQDVLKRTKDESPSPDGQSKSSQGRISLEPDADSIRGDATGAKVLCLGRQCDSRLQSPVTRRLVLVRHGQSVANRSGLFTGLLDSPLTEQGGWKRRQPPAFGRAPLALFCCFHLDADAGRRERPAYPRCARATRLIPQRFAALDERDYGDLSGLDKTTADARWGRCGSRPGAAPTPRRRRTARACAIPLPASCHATSDPSYRRSWAGRAGRRPR